MPSVKFDEDPDLAGHQVAAAAQPWLIGLRAGPDVVVHEAGLLGLDVPGAVLESEQAAGGRLGRCACASRSGQREYGHDGRRRGALGRPSPVTLGAHGGGLLLADVLGLDWQLVHDEACRWEHVMSDAVERRVLDILGHPAQSPYGNPIPGVRELGDDETGGGAQDTIALSAVPETATNLVVRRIGEPVQSDTELLARLHGAGIGPDTAVSVRHAGGGIHLPRSLTDPGNRPVLASASRDRDRGVPVRRAVPGPEGPPSGSGGASEPAGAGPVRRRGHPPRGSPERDAKPDRDRFPSRGNPGRDHPRPGSPPTPPPRPRRPLARPESTLFTRQSPSSRAAVAARRVDPGRGARWRPVASGA
jgi:hypothetical protein